MNHRPVKLFCLTLLTAALAALVQPAQAQPLPAAGVASVTSDARLLGRWVHQSMINSGGGAGGFASFTTERTLDFRADGTVQQSVRSVGGGSSWSSDSGRKLEFAGRWSARDGEVWVQPDGQGSFVNAGRYRFSGKYLITENRQGRQIWER